MDFPCQLPLSMLEMALATRTYKAIFFDIDCTGSFIGHRQGIQKDDASGYFCDLYMSQLICLLIYWDIQVRFTTWRSH